MQKVLTAEQMRTVDRLTTERYGVPSIQLMENAAGSVAGVITEKLGGSVKGRSILIICGKGNNGGDGAALARILWKDAALVTVILFGRIDETRGDARVNFDALASIESDLDSNPEFRRLIIHEGNDGLIDTLENVLMADEIDIIVDGLFGTGLTRELSGEYVRIIRLLDNHRSRIISIDLPSGLDADNADPLGPHVKANATVTFTAPKAANVLPPASRSNGELSVAGIGSPQELIDEQPSQLFVAEWQDAENWLKSTVFDAGSYKNKRGHVLIIAGSESYSGAAVLAGNAAMRSGVGLVTVATPNSSKESVAGRVLPEVMVRGVAETTNGAVATEAFEELSYMLEKVDAIAVGSGLSQNSGTKDFVNKVIGSRRQPVILDADALNLLSPWSVSWPPAHAGVSDLILTPHEGEFMRLLGNTDKGAIKDRVTAVRDFAVKNDVILVLKGERVLVGSPDGRVVVNPTGNSGLGKAGNGDTLTGILAGFVAQASAMKVDIFETVVAAVYVAGMAGDVAEKKYGKRVMTASDVRECLKDVFSEIEFARIM